jgi:hypothetical protein
MKRAYDTCSSSDPDPDLDSFSSLVPDMMRAIASYLLRPSHYQALLLVSRDTAEALSTPAMRMVMTRRYFDPWRRVMANPDVLAVVEEQTPELCLAAVLFQGKALHFVKDQTPALCFAAVELMPWTLQYVREQTPELCLAAVKRQGDMLEYVKEQTPEICMAAVEQNGYAIHSDARAMSGRRPAPHHGALLCQGTNTGHLFGGDSI